MACRRIPGWTGHILMSLLSFISVWSFTVGVGYVWHVALSRGGPDGGLPSSGAGLSHGDPCWMSQQCLRTDDEM